MARYRVGKGALCHTSVLCHCALQMYFEKYQHFVIAMFYLCSKCYMRVMRWLSLCLWCPRNKMDDAMLQFLISKISSW